MKYLLNIGGAEVVAEGKKCGGGFELLYRSEDLPYRLKVTKEKIIHESMGEYGLSLTFEEGKESVGRLRMGNSFADYPVKCTHMKVEIFPEGFTFEVSFGDGEEDKKVTAAAGLITGGMGEQL